MRLMERDAELAGPAAARGRQASASAPSPLVLGLRFTGIRVLAAATPAKPKPARTKLPAEALRTLPIRSRQMGVSPTCSGCR